MTAPFRRERSLLKAQIWPVAGVDEAGRGPLAGPVVAAAVILDPARLPKGVDDSKALAPARREALAARARELVFRAPVREDDALLTAPPLKTRERIAALAVREAEWARQTSGNLATARAWLAQARDRLATRP